MPSADPQPATADPQPAGAVRPAAPATTMLGVRLLGESPETVQRFLDGLTRRDPAATGNGVSAVRHRDHSIHFRPDDRTRPEDAALLLLDADDPVLFDAGRDVLSRRAYVRRQRALLEDAGLDGPEVGLVVVGADRIPHLPSDELPEIRQAIVDRAGPLLHGIITTDTPLTVLPITGDPAGYERVYDWVLRRHREPLSPVWLAAAVALVVVLGLVLYSLGRTSAGAGSTPSGDGQAVSAPTGDPADTPPTAAAPREAVAAKQEAQRQQEAERRRLAEEKRQAEEQRRREERRQQEIARRQAAERTAAELDDLATAIATSRRPAELESIRQQLEGYSKERLGSLARRRDDLLVAVEVRDRLLEFRQASDAFDRRAEDDGAHFERLADRFLDRHPGGPQAEELAARVASLRSERQRAGRAAVAATPTTDGAGLRRRARAIRDYLARFGPEESEADRRDMARAADLADRLAEPHDYTVQVVRSGTMAGDYYHELAVAVGGRTVFRRESNTAARKLRWLGRDRFAVRWQAFEPVRITLAYDPGLLRGEGIAGAGRNDSLVSLRLLDGVTRLPAAEGAEGYVTDPFVECDVAELDDADWRLIDRYVAHDAGWRDRRR